MLWHSLVSIHVWRKSMSTLNSCWIYSRRFYSHTSQTTITIGLCQLPSSLHELLCAPSVWTLTAQTRNFLTYLLTYLLSRVARSLFLSSSPPEFKNKNKRYANLCASLLSSFHPRREFFKLQPSLKEFFSVGHFSNKLKQFLRSAGIASTL